MDIGPVAVVGGAGHIGLPLAVGLASHFKVVIIDKNSDALNDIFTRKRPPFLEREMDEDLQKALKKHSLRRYSNREQLAQCKNLIICVGTPVGQYLYPDLRQIYAAIDEFLPCLPAGARDVPLIVLRSTIPPGGTKRIFDYVRSKHRSAQVVYCPERAMQGYTMRDMRQLPQVIGAYDDVGWARAATLFENLSPCIVKVSPPEAEFVKLLTNNYRYIQFGVVNEMYRLVTDAGLNYSTVEGAMKLFYPPLASMPSPGFAAGPCLRKDALITQNAFPSANFARAAFWENESQPQYLVDHLEATNQLTPGATVGVLGVAFKGENDDTRDSLACRLASLLVERGYMVVVHDPYATHPANMALGTVLEMSKTVIIGAPHEMYAKTPLLGEECTVPVVDIWGILPTQRLKV